MLIMVTTPLPGYGLPTTTSGIAGRLWLTGVAVGVGVDPKGFSTLACGRHDIERTIDNVSNKQTLGMVHSRGGMYLSPSSSKGRHSFPGFITFFELAWHRLKSFTSWVLFQTPASRNHPRV